MRRELARPKGLWASCLRTPAEPGDPRTLLAYPLQVTSLERQAGRPVMKPRVVDGREVRDSQIDRQESTRKGPLETSA